MTVLQRTRTKLAMLIGVAICEPQVRLGRRRHDGTCDRCEDPLGRYSAEKLDFPLEDPSDTTAREKLQAMINAEYVRVCLECSDEVDNAGGDDGAE